MIPEPGIQERAQLGQRRQFAPDALVTILVPGTQQPYGLAMEGVPSVVDGGAFDLMGIM